MTWLTIELSRVKPSVIPNPEMIMENVITLKLKKYLTKYKFLFLYRKIVNSECFS